MANAMAESKVCGQGISYVIDGDEVIIRFNKKTNLGASKSGKMIACANSGGFVTLDDGTKLNLWAGRYPNA